jgi:hypothetical protein
MTSRIRNRSANHSTTTLGRSASVRTCKKRCFLLHAAEHRICPAQNGESKNTAEFLWIASTQFNGICSSYIIRHKNYSYEQNSVCLENGLRKILWGVARHKSGKRETSLWTERRFWLPRFQETYRPWRHNSDKGNTTIYLYTFRHSEIAIVAFCNNTERNTTGNMPRQRNPSLRLWVWLCFNVNITKYLHIISA